MQRQKLRTQRNVMGRTIALGRMNDHFFAIFSKGGMRVSLNPVLSPDLQALETPNFSIVSKKLIEIKEIWIQGVYRSAIEVYCTKRDLYYNKM